MFQCNDMHNMVFELHPSDEFPSTSTKAKKNKHTVDGIYGTPTWCQCVLAIFLSMISLVTTTPSGLKFPTVMLLATPLPS
jgi:hypothetical protein